MGFMDKISGWMHISDTGFEDDEDFLDNEVDEEEERPRTRFFGRRDEEEEEDPLGYDNIDMSKKAEKKPKAGRFQAKQAAYQEEQPVPQAQPAASAKIAPIRQKRNIGGMAVCVFKPRTMEDSQQITETLRDNCTVILNIEGMDREMAQRIIDFVGGACYALRGHQDKVGTYMFLFTPANVNVSGDIQEMMDSAIDMPGVHSAY